MSVKTLPRYRPLAQECGELLVRFSTILSPYAVSVPILLKLLEMAAQLVTKLETAMSLTRASPLSKTLYEKDELRDRIYRDLVKYIRGARSHYISEKAQAAQQLYGIFKQHDLALTMDSYAIESTKLRALLADLSAERCVAWAEELQISGAIGNLAAAESEFAAVYQQLVDSKADVGTLPTVTELASPMRKQIHYILNMVEILEVVEPDTWADAVNEINTVITEVAAKAKARDTMEKSDEEEEEEPITPPLQDANRSGSRTVESAEDPDLN